MARSKGVGRGNHETFFSEKALQRTRVISENRNITNAPESLPHLRKEIARVFHQANRRIQNLQKADVLSPALKALNITDSDKFSQFAMSGKTWLELRIEYQRAIEFLRQPTSTAQGAREYGKHVKESLNLNDREFELLKNKMMDKATYWNEKEKRYVENYLWNYSDFKEIYQEESQSLADKIESQAPETAKPLMKHLGEDVKEMFNSAETLQEKIDVLNQFNGFQM